MSASSQDKPRIAIDFDDVLFPTVPNLLTYYNRRFSADVKIEDVHVFNLWEVWKIDREKAIKIVDEFIAVFDPLPTSPISGALSTLRKLEPKYNLYVVTARMNKYAANTISWLDKYFPGLFQDVIFCDHYGSADQYVSKATICQSLNASYLIDDNLQHVQDCSAAGIPSILFGQYPWNQSHELPNNITRARHWEEARKLIGSIQ